MKKRKRTLVVNLYGGPSVGKSTTAAGLFYKLKQGGYNCELAREYAKDVVWKEATTILDDQNYIFAKQHNKLHYLKDKVDIIITDAPLLLSLVYGDQESDTFKQHVIETYDSYDNMNIMLERFKTFNPAGRLQNEEQARDIDTICEVILEEHCKYIHPVVADETAVDEIMKLIYDNYHN